MSHEVGRERNEAIAGFAKVYASMKSARDEWCGKKDVNAQEPATIRGKLWAYRTFAACNVPVAECRDLRARLKYVAPEKTNRTENEPTTATIQPTARPPALPAVPAMPATPVPRPLTSNPHPAFGHPLREGEGRR